MTEEEVEAVFQGLEDPQGNVNYEGKAMGREFLFSKNIHF